MEVCPDAIIIHAHSTILFVNSAATRLLGHSDQQSLSDTRLCEFIPSDQRERFSRYVQSAMGGAHIPRIEERILPFHGSPIHVEMCGHAVTFNGIRAIQTLIKDISPQRHAEEALHEHHKRWQALLDNMSEAIMILDIDNARIETANPNAQSLDVFSIKVLRSIKLHPYYVRWPTTLRGACSWAKNTSTRRRRAYIIRYMHHTFQQLWASEGGRFCP